LDKVEILSFKNKKRNDSRIKEREIRSTKIAKSESISIKEEVLKPYKSISPIKLSKII
jgi:hypothetical protein